MREEWSHNPFGEVETQRVTVGGAEVYAAVYGRDIDRLLDDHGLFDDDRFAHRLVGCGLRIRETRIRAADDIVDGYFPVTHSNAEEARVSAAMGYLDAETRTRPNLTIVTGALASERLVYVAHKSDEDVAAAVAGTIAGYEPHVSMLFKPVAVSSGAFTSAAILRV